MYTMIVTATAYVHVSVCQQCVWEGERVCVFVYVYMFVCVSVVTCMYVCTCTCVRVCRWVSVFLVRMCTMIVVAKMTHVCVSGVCVCARGCVCVCTCVRVYVFKGVLSMHVHHNTHC